MGVPQVQTVQQQLDEFNTLIEKWISAKNSLTKEREKTRATIKSKEKELEMRDGDYSQYGFETRATLRDSIQRLNLYVNNLDQNVQEVYSHILEKCSYFEKETIPSLEMKAEIAFLIYRVQPDRSLQFVKNNISSTDDCFSFIAYCHKKNMLDLIQPSLDFLAKQNETGSRLRFIQLLVDIQGNNYVSYLWAGMADSSPEVRLRTAHAFGKIGNSSIVKRLTELLGSETEAAVRKEIMNSLGKLDKLPRKWWEKLLGRRLWIK